MNRSFASAHPLPRLAFPAALLAALAIGLATAQQPVLAAAAVIGLTVFLFSVLSPERMSYVIFVSSVVSFQYLFDFKLAGMDSQSFYKIGVLFLCLPAMFRYGIHRKFSLPIFAFGAMLAYTYLLSDVHPLLTASAPVKAFIGLAAPFVFMLIRWPDEVARKQIRLLCLLPLFSIAFGALFQAGGIHPLFVTEFNGAVRLQGANIPAHLAFLAYIGMLVALIEAKRRPREKTFFFVLMAFNFLILLLTGTRGPLLAALPLILVFVIDLVRQFFKGRAELIVPLFGFLSVVGASAYLMLDNFKKRSFERSTGTGIDLSGRSEAWAFFLNGVKDSPWFGRGLGSVLVSNDGSIFEGFVVPHNEYIRFYYDGGLVGAVLLFASLLYVFAVVRKRVDQGVRVYYGAFILGFLVYSFSDNTLSTIQFTVPFLAYLSALYQSGKTGPPGDANPASQKPI